MSEIAEVLKAVTKMQTSMATSFGNVHKKIDEKFDECDDRLIILEKSKVANDAVANVKEKMSNFWLVAIRSIMVASALALGAIAYRAIFPL